MITNCFGIPDEYLGRTISQGPDDLFYAKSAGFASWDDLRDHLDNERAAMRELVEALHQYRNDLTYPLAADSIVRRIAMIDALIGKTNL